MIILSKKEGGMDEQRRETIIREINYWKQSKLLPETYCDFLLTLYTEGDPGTSSRLKTSRSLAMKGFISFIFVLLLFIVTIINIYFTNYSIEMQITFVLLASACSIFIGVRTLRHDESFAKFYFLMASIKIFLISLHSLDRFLEESRLATLGLLFLASLFWFFGGYRWKSKFFYIAAILAMIAFVSFFFYFY